MKASQIIDSELKRNRPAEPGKEIVLSATLDGISVRVKLQDWDRLAVSLTGLTVKAVTADDPEDKNSFAERCHHLADRLNYLEEPLRAIEIDSERRIGIIRSYPPRDRFNSKSYFEVIFNGKEKHICLVRKDRFSISGKDMPDKVVIGYQILVRLIDDLVENISQMNPVEK